MAQSVQTKTSRLLAAGAALTLFCIATVGVKMPSAAPFPVKAAMAPIDQVLAAMSSGDSKRLAGVYSSDAVIVDDQAPFQWTGSNAGEDWFATTAGRWGKLWYGKFVPTLRSPLQPAANMQFGPASAYVTVPGKLTSRLAGKRIDQRGVLTFTLRRVSGAWKITSQIWTSTS